MKIWTGVPQANVEDWPLVAKHAESVGIDGLGLGDHLGNPKRYESVYPNLDVQGKRSHDGRAHPPPLIVIAAMSAVTTELEFSIHVMLVPLHHPILLAKDVATVARMARGRFQYGVGVGWMREEYEWLGLDFDTRGKRFDEMLDLMKAFWRGEFVSSDTEFFKFGEIQFLPYPNVLPPPIPLYFGGQTPVALRRAGRIGDGWVSMPTEIDVLKGCLKQIDEERQRHGRENEPFEVRVIVPKYPDRDMVKRFEEAGATSIHVPSFYSMGLDNPGLQSTLDKFSKLGDDIREWKR